MLEVDHGVSVTPLVELEHASIQEEVFNVENILVIVGEW